MHDLDRDVARMLPRFHPKVTKSWFARGMDAPLPLLGASLRTTDLPARLEWLLAEHRDLELTDPLSADFFDGEWRATGREAARRLTGHAGRRGVHAPFDGFPVDAPDWRSVSAMRDRLYECLEFCTLAGGSHLVVHSPFLYFGRADAVHRGDALAAQIRRARCNLEPVVEEARKAACVLVFENIFDLRPEPLDQLVASFQSEHVRRSLDTGHAHLMAERGAPPPDVWVEAAGGLLAHVHLADNDGRLDRHWACGAGGIAWPAFFRALRRLPTPPRLILEMTPELQVESCRWLGEQGLAR
jgi:sugar phosphate isomerase/epimerase